MESQKIRSSFISYFSDKGYQAVDSASLVPADDPTLLFVNAGMVQFKDVFLGEEKRAFKKACSSQKCVRAGGKHNDLDQVGLTARHHTFFEMLGHFVFEGASKSEAIKDAWTLLTSVYGIPEEKLIATVYKDDEESRKIWEQEIGLSQDRVISCGEKDNFWSMGEVGPCGPCTEIFYDHGPEVAGGKPGSADADGDRYVEIWNLVFMQYNMKADGSRDLLPSLGLDTGMGLERISAVLQGVQNNFDTDLFMPIIKSIQEIEPNVDIVTARVIADHIRTSVFLISDGVYPSNEGRGYVLRRIMRRAIGFAYKAGITHTFMTRLADIVIKIFDTAYPALAKKSDVIKQIIEDEEQRFSKTISQGMKLLESRLEQGVQEISGEDVFKLYDTYGFPLDMTERIASSRDIRVDYDGYQRCMAQQQMRSREHAQFSQVTDSIQSKAVSKFVGYDAHTLRTTIEEIWVDENSVSSINAEQEGVIVMPETTFYPEGGGQVGDRGIIKTDQAVFVVTDTQKSACGILHFGHIVSGKLSTGDTVEITVDDERHMTACNHSATHLLHAALRLILGPHVLQKGSLVNAERLRFDFAHTKPLSFEQIQAVERCVNLEVRRNHPREVQWMSLSQAKEQDVMALFDEKYADDVRVMNFGEFSRELCGGVHVQSTGEIGLFVITQETGIASGVRRIEALTGEKAIQWVQDMQSERQTALEALRADPEMLLNKLTALISKEKQGRKEIARLMQKVYAAESVKWVENALTIDGVALVCQILDVADVGVLRSVMDSTKSVLTSGVIVLFGKQDAGKYHVLVSSQQCSYDAQQILKHLLNDYEGRGGGKVSHAQGVVHASNLDDIEQQIKAWINDCHVAR